MSRNRSLAVFLVIFVAALASGIGAQVDQTHWASVRFTANQIIWVPSASGNRLSVTVTGPGDYAFTHVYKKNELAIFQAIDPDGNPLPDGSYNYEIEELLDNPNKRPANDKNGLPEKSPGKGPLFQRLSGSFTVLNGVLVDPNLEESPGKKNNALSAGIESTVGLTPEAGPFSGDLTIYNSLCVGFDCASAESYDFDTIRLKENNLRIHFDDTSISGSFPKRDWRIIANDTTNGGLERFSIEDTTANRIPFTIEGNARANALYIDDGGRVGFGTSTPALELHVTDGDTPALRLEQTGSSGFTPQTWDVAGNETSFFIRDATNGSTLPFRIRPGAPSSAIDVKPATVEIGRTSSLPVIETSASQLTVNTAGAQRFRITDRAAILDGPNFAQVRINAPTSPGSVGLLTFGAGGSTYTSGEILAEVRSELNQFSPLSGSLVFRINPGGTLTERMRINATGVSVNGTLTKTAGSFKIDHPLDPANQYLYHSFVESPDMMNIYNGIVELDQSGTAVVMLPPWFDALNGDFRYQLTPIGQPEPDLFISAEIHNNSFGIAGGSAGAKVSWQVTGVRHDPFAQANRIQVEQPKPLAEKGTYIFPEYYDSATRDTPLVSLFGGNSPSTTNRTSPDIPKENLGSQLERLAARLAAVESLLELSPQCILAPQLP